MSHTEPGTMPAIGATARRAAHPCSSSARELEHANKIEAQSEIYPMNPHPARE